MPRAAENAAAASAALPRVPGRLSRQPKVTATAAGRNCLLQKLKRRERTNLFPCVGAGDAQPACPGFADGSAGAARRRDGAGCAPWRDGNRRGSQGQGGTSLRGASKVPPLGSVPPSVPPTPWQGLRRDPGQRSQSSEGAKKGRLYVLFKKKTAKDLIFKVLKNGFHLSPAPGCAAAPAEGAERAGAPARTPCVPNPWGALLL